MRGHCDLTFCVCVTFATFLCLTFDLFDPGVIFLLTEMWIIIAPKQTSVQFGVVKVFIDNIIVALKYSSFKQMINHILT